MEQWRDIKGFEGIYQVSDLGRVKALNYHREGKERIMVGIKHKTGYLMVNLCRDGKQKLYGIHQLVADAFISNPDGLPMVNHKDESRDNNVASNLEWCDCKYNNNYGTRNERIAKALCKPVYQYTMDGSLVRSYTSIKEASQQTGYNRGDISLCCNGKYNQYKGFIWSHSPLVPKEQLF